MKKLIQLTADLAILPHDVFAVQRSGLDEAECVVFSTGQSTTDGFKVDRDIEDVVDEVNAALRQEAIDKARLAAEATAELEHEGKPKFRILKKEK